MSKPKIWVTKVALANSQSGYEARAYLGEPGYAKMAPVACYAVATSSELGANKSLSKARARNGVRPKPPIPSSSSLGRAKVADLREGSIWAKIGSPEIQHLYFTNNIHNGIFATKKISLALTW